MIFNTIEKIRPYFSSLREIDGNVSLDMRFPLKWKHEYNDEKLKILVQDKNDRVNLVSFVTSANSEGYDLVFSVAQSIIKYNMELEEKENLFQQKITELKDLFTTESLDKLKNIQFIKDKPVDPEIEVNEEKIKLDDTGESGQEDSSGDGVVG